MRQAWEQSKGRVFLMQVTRAASGAVCEGPRLGEALVHIHGFCHDILDLGNPALHKRHKLSSYVDSCIASVLHCPLPRSGLEGQDVIQLNTPTQKPKLALYSLSLKFKKETKAEYLSSCQVFFSLPHIQSACSVKMGCSFFLWL